MREDVRKTREGPSDSDERALDGFIRQAARVDRAPVVPTDFADQVVGAIRRRRRRMHAAITVGALVALAAAIALVVGRLPQAATSGQHQAAARQEIPLGDRGVAVLEADSALAWTELDGQRRWQQSRGDVFYRVEPGAAFRVATPAGDIEVLGTCFRVEVDPMNINRQGKIGAAVGAAVATLVMVTVYEGRVRLASGNQQLRLAAGERGQLTAGAPPVRVAEGERAGGAATALAGIPRLIPAGTPADTAAELQQLRQQVAEQQHELARLRVERPGRPEDHRFVDVSKEQLLERAARCELRYDLPPVLDAVPKPATPENGSGMSDIERDAMNEVIAEVHGSAGRQLRKLYVEIGGDGKVADGMSPGSLINELMQKVPPEEAEAGRTRLARERAGLQAPPPDLNATPAAERLFRLVSTLGDEFERKLGERIGADRAHALRARRDGWGGSRSSHSGCSK